jgi:hypothetical protein
LTLKTDGSAQGKGVLLNVGQDAPGVRRAFESVATRTSTLEQQFSQSFPGLEASEVTLSDPRALEQPVSLSFAMKLPRFAEAAPTALRFFPFGASRAFTQALAPLSERAHDVVLPGVWTNRLKFTYTLPVGWAVAQVPAETVLESPFGRLSITVRTEGAKLVVEGAMVVARARVTAQDYAAFRAWLLQVDQAFSRKLVVQRGEQTAAVR